MIDNFYIYTDSEGKMRVLSRKPMSSTSHRFYVRYVNNRPVEFVAYPGQESAWDYSKCCYVPLSDIKTARRTNDRD